MFTQQQNFQTAIHQYSQACLCLVSAAFLLPLLILRSYMNTHVMIIVGLLCAFHLGWIPVVKSFTIEAIRRTFIWYSIGSSLLMLPLVFLVAGENGPTSCLCFLVFPLTCYVILPSRKVIGCVVFALALILAAYMPHCIYEYPLSDYIAFENTGRHYDRSLFVLYNMMNLLIVFFHICITLYYINKLHQIREMEKSLSAEVAPIAESDCCKYDALYQRIVDFMKSDETFRDPNFKIAHLATATESNVSYVSNAIHEKTAMNFVAFINSYRVEFAKKALQQADAKYTIEHLSQSSGFSHQTTFNRVFKASEGLTPTEYMNLHQKANTDEQKELRIEN